jgi:hypothetical protein
LGDRCTRQPHSASGHASSCSLVQALCTRRRHSRAHSISPSPTSPTLDEGADLPEFLDAGRIHRTGCECITRLGHRRRRDRHAHRVDRKQRPAPVAGDNDVRAALPLAPDRRVSLYVQGPIAEANGFRSIIPATAGSQPDANGFAAQIGGGVDYRLSGRFAIRVLDAGWTRTQLPNSTDNVQNTLRLGTGIVLRFAH